MILIGNVNDFCIINISAIVSTPKQVFKLLFYFEIKTNNIHMENLLNIAKEISSSDYMNLKNPEFKGQTRLDVNYQYWMVFEDNGVLYKIHNSLYGV